MKDDVATTFALNHKIGTMSTNYSCVIITMSTMGATSALAIIIEVGALVIKVE